MIFNDVFKDINGEISVVVYDIAPDEKEELLLCGLELVEGEYESCEEGDIGRILMTSAVCLDSGEIIALFNDDSLATEFADIFLYDLKQGNEFYIREV